MVVPPSLSPAIEILSDYLQNTKDRRTVVAVGSAGCGRGHFVAATLVAHGYKPVWCYDPTPVGNLDLDGNRTFPVYDLSDFAIPSPRSIVFVGSAADVPAKQKNEVVVIGFPEPTAAELEQFVAAHGYDRSLAAGQRNYSDATHAMLVWDLTHERWSRDTEPLTTWETYRTGGPPPVNDGAFLYYAGYHFPPANDEWNYVAWLRRHIPVSVSRLADEAVRIAWPPGRVEFPSILRARKAGGKERSPLAPKPMTESLPVEKGYHIDW